MFRALLITLGLMGTAYAQSVPSVAPEIVGVTTVGWWKSGERSGRYRIITTIEGWEHVWSRVYVEWLADPGDRKSDTKPVAIAELVPPIPQGSAVLEAFPRQNKNGGIMVAVHATSNAKVGAKPRLFKFQATAPGKVKLIEQASKK